jgi:hypothetical protein
MLESDNELLWPPEEVVGIEVDVDAVSGGGGGVEDNGIVVVIFVVIKIVGEGIVIVALVVVVVVVGVVVVVVVVDVVVPGVGDCVGGGPCEHIQFPLVSQTPLPLDDPQLRHGTPEL